MQTLANRVKPISPLTANNIPSRYQWLSLKLAEPNLGSPVGTGVFVLTATNVGDRGWTLFVTPKDFEDLLAQSITARDLVAFKFRAGENSVLADGIENSYILGNNIVAGYPNTTFVTNLCAQQKIYNTTGGSLILDTLTAFEFQAGRNNRKINSADGTSFIIGNQLTVRVPNFTYVNNLSSASDLRSLYLYNDVGGKVKLDELTVTSLSALSAFNVITDFRTVVLSFTSISADDIYAKGNITSAKTVSGVRGEFYELSSTRFFAGNNISFGPFANDTTFVLGENIRAVDPNTTYVENLSTVKNLYIGGSLFANSGNFNVDTIKTKELSATYFTAGSGNRYRGQALGEYANSFIIGAGITAGFRNTTFVNNLCAVDRITSNSLTARFATFDGISSRNLNVGSNNIFLPSASNSYIIGNNITASIPNTLYSNSLYTNALSVVGDVVITGILSANVLAGAEDIATTVKWVRDNGVSTVQRNSLISSQSAYWNEPVRRFEYIYLPEPQHSYSGVAPASARADVFSNVWTITRIYYTVSGAVSAVERAFNISWSSRAVTPLAYTRIWP